MGLGDKLREAMERLRNATFVDAGVVKESVKDIQRALIAADVEVSLVLSLSQKIEKEALKEPPEGISKKEYVLKVTHDCLAELLGRDKPVPEKPKTILLLGLFGGGKTTTAGKLAKYYMKRGNSVGLVAGDIFRPAAVEQLKQLSEKVGAHFYSSQGEKRAEKVVENALKESKDDVLIVDSAGRSALDEELVKEIKAIAKALKPEQVWLVLGADMGQLASKQAKAFHESVGVNGVIVTRMDGSAKGGGALAACAHTQAPVYFIGTGEKMEDLEAFNAVRFLSRVMGYGDLQALLEKVQEVQETTELNPEELLKGEFTLEVFYQQLKAARSMGPLQKVMEMAGLSAQIPKEMMEQGEARLDGFKIIMDSMTKKEKADPELLDRSRILRIAKGSGKSEEEVRELLKQFKQMKQMFKKFKKLENVSEKDLKSGKLQKMLQGMQKKKKFKIR
ncbi:MAG: signal recognition particle receptor subunit alpha [Candidatus Diapherotrites archaeon]